jgi:hypothetical protein
MVGRVLTVVAITAGLTTGAAAQRTRRTVVDESTITRTLAFAGPGERTLDIRAINGSIRVQGTDDTAVQISIKKVIRAETDADLADAQRDVQLDFAEQSARVGAVVRDSRNQVCGEPSHDNQRWPRVRYDVTFDFTVRVPKNTQLRLCTINGGEVRVAGTIGNFDVDNVNGLIDMALVAGSGRATTVNGPVTVSFTANPSASSVFSTVNGNVDVTFQDGLSADLKMKTFNGGLFTDFDVQALPQTVAAAGERRNGRFVYRSNSFTQVRAGSGGPEHTFETLNGNVRALRATR